MKSPRMLHACLPVNSPSSAHTQLTLHKHDPLVLWQQSSLQQEKDGTNHTKESPNLIRSADLPSGFVLTNPHPSADHQLLLITMPSRCLFLCRQEKVSSWIKQTSVLKLFIFLKGVQVGAARVTERNWFWHRGPSPGQVLLLAAPTRAIWCPRKGQSLHPPMPAFARALLRSETSSLTACYPKQLASCILVLFIHTQKVFPAKKMSYGSTEQLHQGNLH